MSPPGPPPAGAPDPLAPPRGLWGHLRYSYHAVRRWRRLGQTLDLLDERLRVAVVRRDEALARLGQAALGDSRGGQQVLAFHETLTQLDSDLAAAEAAREATRAERVAAQGEQQEAQARFEMRLEATRLSQAAVSAQQERERKLLSRQEAQLARIERRILELSAPPAAADEASGEAAPPALDPAPPALDPAPPALAHQPARAELAAQAEDARAQCAELAGRLAALEAEAAGVEAELAALEEDRRDTLASIAEALRALDEEGERAARRVERLQARRRAVLMDLGHEVLAVFPEDAGPSHQEAREALEHIERLRAEHAEVERQREGVDLAPALRTGILLCAAAVASLLLWALAR